MAGAATIAGAVAFPLRASSQTAVTDDNPDLEPIRALLDAHDTAFTNHDLQGVLDTMSEKASIMGCGPGEVWSGPEEIKEALEHLFESFDMGEQNFEYEFSIGELASETGWMMTSGNVSGKKDGKDLTFPVNISLSVKKEGGKWLIAAKHFSMLTDEIQNEE